MSKQLQPRNSTVLTANRPNEGTVLDVGVYTHPNVGGQSVTMLGADLSKTPVPDRKFTADTAFLIVLPHTIKMVFGQERLDGRLRSAIIVQMSRNAGVNFVRGMDGMTGPSLAEIAQRERISAENPKPITEEPDQALTLSANTPVAAFSGTEGCIDFYQASPFSMAVAQRSKKLALEAVVRVTLRTSLVLGMLDTLRSTLSTELTTAATMLQELEHD